MAATPVTTGDDPPVITALGPMFRVNQGLFWFTAGNFGELGNGSLAGTWGIRSVRTDAHGDIGWLHG
jgi:hypothetical protein